MSHDNILLNEWNTPHQTPPFSMIRNEHFASAVHAAIAESETAIQNISKQESAPSFENTIDALERSTDRLDTVCNLLFNLNECNTNPEMQDLVIELTPTITRFENGVWMNEQLFARVKAVYDRRDTLNLTIEQKQVLEKYYQHFIRGGVNLDAGTKAKFSANNEELALLQERFNQNVLADTNAFTLHITEHSDLAGLPDNVVAEARAEAEARHMDGWVVTLKAPSYRPFMQFADNRDLRKRLWMAYNKRGNNNNTNNNNDIIRRIVQLRLEQARMLGYDNYASLSLGRTMAQNVETVNTFLSGLLEACAPTAKRDVDEVKKYALGHGANFELQSWDFSYYSEKLKKEQYDFDSELMRPYFQLEKVRQGIFNLYGKLYGLTFHKSSSIEVYQDDVHAYEVYDGDRFMGVLYLDMFPRDNKRGGAWMTEFRCQSCLDGHQVRPQIQIVCNFSKPVGDRPSLLSFDEVETFMHEFGHAMHGLLSDVTYPSVSCTKVRHDFVEMPSQVMENWCYEPEFLNTFANHYQTGKLIPAEYIERIRKSEKYLAGHLCLRQLNFGRLDMAYHTLEQELDKKPDCFEQEHTVSLLPSIEGTGISTSFTHIFCGGYAAGYYGYKWAEVLDADIFSKFKADGIFNRETSEAFRKEILSRGGSEHPSVLFRNFMGRDPNNKALLRRCGFIDY